MFVYYDSGKFNEKCLICFRWASLCRGQRAATGWLWSVDISPEYAAVLLVRACPRCRGLEAEANAEHTVIAGD